MAMSQFPYNTYHHMPHANSMWPVPTPHWPMESWDRQLSNVSLPKTWPENDVHAPLTPSNEKQIKDTRNSKEKKDKESKDSEKKKSCNNSSSKKKDEKAENESKTLDLDTR